MNDVCSLCHKKFSFPRSLQKHMIKIHKSYLDENEKLYKCLDCDNSYRINRDLIYHLETTHGVRIEREELTFENHNDFAIWKRNIEISESCNYNVYEDESKSNDEPEIIKYLCNRSGPFFKNRDSGKRSWSCISSMETIEDPNGDLYVTRVKTHYGHELEGKQSEVSLISNESESMEEDSEGDFLEEYQKNSILKEDIRMKLDAISYTLHKFENKQLVNLDNALNGICKELDLATNNTDNEIIGSIIISSNSNLDHSYI